MARTFVGFVEKVMHPPRASAGKANSTAEVIQTP
jgi:hypothetical protein